MRSKERFDLGILFLLGVLLLSLLVWFSRAEGKENELIAERTILATDNLNADFKAAFLSAVEELRKKGCVRVDAAAFVNVEESKEILLIVVCVELAPQEEATQRGK